MVYLPEKMSILMINNDSNRTRRFIMLILKKISVTFPAKKWFYGTLMILIMGIIFLFSSQPGEESYEVSSSVANLFVKAGFHWNIRKCAHVFLYFYLGVSSSLFFGKCLSAKNRWRPLNAAVYSAALCILYSCLDEWHQTFVAGRAGRLMDVGVDAIGFGIGIMAIFVVNWLSVEFRRKI